MGDTVLMRYLCIREQEQVRKNKVDYEQTIFTEVIRHTRV